MFSIAEWTDRASALSYPKKLTSSASFSPSIRISLRLKIHQAQAKNFCRVLDIRVAQIMKSNMLAPCVLQDELQSAAHHAGCDGIVLLHRRRKHPAGVHRLFALPQHRHHGGRQDDFADGGLRLGRADLELTAHIVDLLVHIQHAGFEVQVVPLQRHQLTTP